MSRLRTVHRCGECGAMAPRWTGRCPGCGEWNTLVEEVIVGSSSSALGLAGTGIAGGIGGGLRGGGVGFDAPVPLAEVSGQGAVAIPTGVDELDRVLGGGLVPGSVTLVGGEPGIGKSTLLLQVVAQMARRGAKCLVVSAEESPSQVRGRAGRMDALVPGVWLAALTTIPSIQAAVAELAPDVLVIDSIQTVFDPEIDSSPGSVAQVRGCAQNLTAAAKSGGPATILVGHVTKEGTLAGPRVLEHLVDTVLSFEGDRHHALRLLRALKHRFGPTGELGLFEMTEAGLAGVTDPGALFLADRRVDTPGSVVFPAMEGHRPLLVEVQALVAQSTGGGGGSGSAGAPCRSVSGFASARLSLLLAVLDRRAGLSFAGHDVYLSIVGGVKVSDPGADLAVCLALASALTHRCVDAGTAVVGEIGLAGEVRQVAHTPRRLAEAARLGFSHAVVPAGAPTASAASGGAPTASGGASDSEGVGAGPGLVVHPVSDLLAALDQHLGRSAESPRLRLVT